jgi:hypothetical protein
MLRFMSFKQHARVPLWRFGRTGRPRKHLIQVLPKKLAFFPGEHARRRDALRDLGKLLPSFGPHAGKPDQLYGSAACLTGLYPNVAAA